MRRVIVEIMKKRNNILNKREYLGFCLISGLSSF
jgi:hypothetical protein